METEPIEPTQQHDHDVETELIKPTEQDDDNDEYNLTSGIKSTSNTSTFSSKKVRVISAAITLGFSLVLLILFLLHDNSPPPQMEDNNTTSVPVPTCLTSSCTSSPAKILADEVLGYPICPCPLGCEGSCTPEERALGWMVHTDDEFYTYDAEKDNVLYDYLKERFLLATFYYTTRGENEGQDPYAGSSWLETKDHCEWTGITCDASHVQGIKLPHYGLSGTIPFTILCKIHQIEELDLFGNKGLTGNPIPATIGLMTSLWSLGLGRGSFNSTSIPTEIGQLHQLTYLNLIDVNIFGNIPTEMGNLTSLVSLSIGENKLNGSLPDEIRSWTNLQVLDVNHNKLDGTIPLALGRMSLLQKLDLSHNALDGTISEVEFRPLAQTMVQLDLSSNEFSGNIPEELGEFQVLRKINLGENSFNGPIPDDLGGLALLEEFMIEGNAAITGFVPDSMCNLRSSNENGFALSHLIADCRMCPNFRDGSLVEGCYTDCVEVQ